MPPSNPATPSLVVNRLAPAPGQTVIPVDGQLYFTNPADLDALLAPISASIAAITSFATANPDFATTFSTLTSQISALNTTVAANGASIANLTPDVQTPTFTAGVATVTLTKPRTFISIPTTSPNTAFTVKLNEGAKQDGWEVVVYYTKTTTAGGSFTSSASVALKDSTGATTYALMNGQGLLGSYHYYAVFRWDAATGKWIRTAAWESGNTNSSGGTAPLNAGQAWSYSVGNIGGGFGLVKTNDVWFQNPPVTKAFDFDLNNGTNAYAVLIPDTTKTLADHDTINVTVQDFTGSSYTLPATGYYELNVDGAGVASGNTGISAASLNAGDVFAALATAVETDLLSLPPVAYSFWDGTAWNLEIINGVGSSSGISIWSNSGQLMTAGYLIASADGSNPLTGWTLGTDGNIFSTLEIILAPSRGYRILDVQLIPRVLGSGYGTVGATLGNWNSPMTVSSDSWGDLLQFGYTGFSTGADVKSLVNNSPDIAPETGVLNLDYPSGSSIYASLAGSADMSTQQFATLRVIADFK